MTSTSGRRPASAFTLTEGDPHSPAVLHIPHAGTWIPDEARSRFLVADWELVLELRELTDAHTDLIADDAARMARARPWSLVNHVSRFVVDPERLPDDREEMAKVGMGAVYTRGTRGQPLRRPDVVHDAELLATYYHPWAHAAQTLVTDRVAALGCAVLIDIHSYPTVPLPYELHGDGPRPPICLGTDAFHTPAWLVDVAADAFAPLGTVGIDTPFSGSYVPLAHHRADGRVVSLMIEVRRDLYMVEPGGPPTAGAQLVARALATLIDVASSALIREAG